MKYINYTLFLVLSLARTQCTNNQSNITSGSSVFFLTTDLEDLVAQPIQQKNISLNKLFLKLDYNALFNDTELLPSSPEEKIFITDPMQQLLKNNNIDHKRKRAELENSTKPKQWNFLNFKKVKTNVSQKKLEQKKSTTNTQTTEQNNNSFTTRNPYSLRKTLKALVFNSCENNNSPQEIATILDKFKNITSILNLITQESFNKKEKIQASILNFAAEKRPLAYVEALLKNVIELNKKIKYYTQASYLVLPSFETALYYAQKGNNTEVIKFLTTKIDEVKKSNK